MHLDTGLLFSFSTNSVFYLQNFSIELHIHAESILASVMCNVNERKLKETNHIERLSKGKAERRNFSQGKYDQSVTKDTVVFLCCVFLFCFCFSYVKYRV